MTDKEQQNTPGSDPSDRKAIDADDEAAAPSDTGDEASGDEAPGEDTEDPHQAATTEDAEALGDSATEDSLTEKASVAPASDRRRRSRLGALALLLALIALGLVGYLGWRIEFAPQDKTVVDLTATVSRLDTRVDATAQNAKDALAGEVGTLNDQITKQQAALKVAENAMAEALAQQHNLEPPSAREWKLAEVEYLLRVANHRLLMERDAVAAADLLGAADSILEEVDDYSLHQVRALLADERMALGNLTNVDIQGIFLRLEAIKNQIQALPIRLPRYVPDGGPPVVEDAPEPTTWQMFVDRVLGLVEVRRHEGLGVHPLLGPDEAMYLEQNLRLGLERAQLAALRQDQVIFEVSLESIQGWLDDYLNQDDFTVRAVQDEIDELLAISLNRDMPDISRSLTRLNQLRRAGERAGQ